MSEDDGDSMNISKEEFDMIVKKFEDKKKKSYNFLVKAGDGFKNSIYKLCSRIIEEEVFPDRFFDTLLQQLWEKKFPREDLRNHRFLHMKDWLPKTCEAMIVSQTRPRRPGLKGHPIDDNFGTLFGTPIRDPYGPIWTY